MIISLHTAHADSIVRLLQQYYQKLNTYLGVAYYNADYEFLYQHIYSRLEAQDWIYYQGIENETGELVACINYQEDSIHKKLNIWMVIGSLEHKWLLLDHCIDVFKKNDYKYFSCEVFDNEEDVKNLFEQKGLKKLSNNYFLS